MHNIQAAVETFNKRKSFCILLVTYIVVLVMHGHTNIKYITYIEALSCSHCCRGKALIITYSESVFVALGIQHTMRVHHIIICGLSDYTIFFFPSTLSHKWYNFRKRKKKLLNTKFVFWFSLQFLSETFFILKRFERDTIKNVYRS